ncbi:retropepsin-like aspartic protease family protein [Aurantiacibacter suaedae]|uniref:retropepsin-like aspartic protease family protein n=1 Tax=Aurantiacibacter suaedae TaxID=2545755 RepID=UPI001F4F7E50|nr:TIGR02281 family clan AA aspartic protease [Aurantiacibacter suaedae]
MNMGPPLAATCLVGLAIGFGMPMEQGEPAPAQAAPTLRPDATAANWSDDVTLARAGDGHFYAEVQLDAAPARMLVDTGASMIALTEDDALAAGLYWDQAELTTVARGASGPVRGVFVTLPQVSLGGIEAQDVAAVVVPEGLPISLLGQSFLTHVNKVAIEGDAMVLSQ